MKLYKLYILLIFVMIPLAQAGKVTYRLPFTGESMMPTISPTNKVYVNVVTSNDIINLNDIICFNPDYRYFSGGNYRYVCHRVIDIKDNTFLTQGDNNFYSDYYVTRKDIAFKVIRVA